MSAMKASPSTNQLQEFTLNAADVTEQRTPVGLSRRISRREIDLLIAMITWRETATGAVADSHYMAEVF